MSDWAVRRFQDTTGVSGLDKNVQFFDPTQKAVKVKCVCGHACNSGWMKRLEDSIIELVLPMMEGNDTKLDVLQQWTVARWAVMKAMVWDQVSKDHPPFFTDEERFGVRDGNLPPSTVVWLAAYVGTETFYTATRRGINDATVPPMEANWTTMAYRKLVIQILSIRPNQQTDPYALFNCDQAKSANAITRIWPTTTSAAWPPLDVITSGSLFWFHTRCNPPKPGIDPYQPDGYTVKG